MCTAVQYCTFTVSITVQYPACSSLLARAHSVGDGAVTACPPENQIGNTVGTPLLLDTVIPRGVRLKATRTVKATRVLFCTCDQSDKFNVSFHAGSLTLFSENVCLFATYSRVKKVCSAFAVSNGSIM